MTNRADTIILTCREEADKNADEDNSNSFVYGEVVGEGGLKHERQTFHDEVEVPGDRSVHLALPMPTGIDNRSTHPDLSVTIEPFTGGAVP